VERCAPVCCRGTRSARALPLNADELQSPPAAFDPAGSICRHGNLETANRPRDHSAGRGKWGWGGRARQTSEEGPSLERRASNRDAQFILRRGRSQPRFTLTVPAGSQRPPAEAAEPRLKIRYRPQGRPTPAIRLQRGLFWSAWMSTDGCLRCGPADFRTALLISS